MSKNFYRCLNGGDCDTINGTCICPAGFMGVDCSQKVSRALLLCIIRIEVLYRTYKKKYFETKVTVDFLHFHRLMILHVVI